MTISVPTEASQWPLDAGGVVVEVPSAPHDRRGTAFGETSPSEWVDLPALSPLPTAKVRATARIINGADGRPTQIEIAITNTGSAACTVATDPYVGWVFLPTALYSQESQRSQRSVAEVIRTARDSLAALQPNETRTIGWSLGSSDVPTLTFTRVAQVDAQTMTATDIEMRFGSQGVEGFVQQSALLTGPQPTCAIRSVAVAPAS